MSSILFGSFTNGWWIALLLLSHLNDEVLGPRVMRVASFFPFQTTYYLNGHSFMEQELNRQGVAFRKHDNALLSTSDQSLLLSRLYPGCLRRGDLL